LQVEGAHREKNAITQLNQLFVQSFRSRHAGIAIVENAVQRRDSLSRAELTLSFNAFGSSRRFLPLTRRETLRVDPLQRSSGHV